MPPLLSAGASWFQRFWRITLPLLEPGIVAGWLTRDARAAAA